MAGLYIRKLIMRADARRILIVAPGSLVEQWRDELFEKFGLEFHIFSKELEAASPRSVSENSSSVLRNSLETK
jgi:SNF2 family DNA or RNA helicase